MIYVFYFARNHVSQVSQKWSLNLGTFKFKKSLTRFLILIKRLKILKWLIMCKCDTEQGEQNQKIYIHMNLLTKFLKL